MDNKPKILFAFTESGLGHITSMQAIKEGIEKKYSDDFELVSIYPMNDDGPAKKYENFMIKQVINTNGHRGLGKFIFALLEVFGRQFFLRLFHRTIIKKSTDSVVNRFKEECPDIIISTNHYTTFCALEYQNRINPKVFVATYNPDNNTHVWWDNREKVFIVNSDKAYDEAISRHFKKEQLYKVGYTVRKTLVEYNLSKEESRKKYGLPLDKFTVILADGAYASANAKDFTLELLKTEKPLTVLFIAGKNQQMFETMSAIKDKLKSAGKENITLEVYPFMPDIHELYRAADMFITKGGPNSIYDSIYMGTPVVVNYCSQPMEQQSYNLWVKDYHCGVGCFSKRKIRPLIENYIDNPQQLDEYKKNIAKFQGCPSGSEAAAEIIYAQYQKFKESNNGQAK